jgi:hypothetical protein
MVFQQNSKKLKPLKIEKAGKNKEDVHSQKAIGEEGNKWPEPGVLVDAKTGIFEFTH